MKNQASKKHVSRWTRRMIVWGVVVLTASVLPKPTEAQMTSFNDTVGEHAIFVGSDFHVHQLLCSPTTSDCGVNTNWSNQDLTKKAGGTGAGVASTLASFADAFGEHVFFVDGVQHLNQLSSTDGISWTNRDLGAQSWGGAITGYSAPGQLTDSNIIEGRLFYETSDQHVHMQVSANGGGFGDTDLTKVTGGPLAMWGTSFTSFHDSSGEHVFYVGADFHLHQLFGPWVSSQRIICNPFTHMCQLVTFSFVNWTNTNQDLTQQTNAPLAEGGLTGFTDASGENVFYVAQDNHVHMVFGPAPWTDQDLSNAFGILPASAAAQSTSLSNGGEGQLFIVGTDMDVHDLVGLFPGQAFGQGLWYLLTEGFFQPPNKDMTTSTGAPITSPCFGWQLTSFSRAVGQNFENEVFYAATDGKVHRFSQAVTLSSFTLGSITIPIFVQGPWSDVNLIPSTSEVGLPFRCFN